MISSYICENVTMFYIFRDCPMVSKVMLSGNYLNKEKKNTFMFFNNIIRQLKKRKNLKKMYSLYRQYIEIKGLVLSMGAIHLYLYCTTRASWMIILSKGFLSVLVSFFGFYNDYKPMYKKSLDLCSCLFSGVCWWCTDFMSHLVSSTVC